MILLIHRFTVNDVHKRISLPGFETFPSVMYFIPIFLRPVEGNKYLEV